MRVENFAQNPFAHRAPYKAKIYFPGCFVMFTVPHGAAYVPLILLPPKKTLFLALFWDYSKYVGFRDENHICGALTYTRAIYTQNKKYVSQELFEFMGFGTFRCLGI